MLKNIFISTPKFLPYLESSYCNLLVQDQHKYKDRDKAEVMRLVLLCMVDCGKTDAMIFFLFD